MFKRIRDLFCRHKNHEVFCWHWTHGYNDNDIRFLEIELKCKDCGRYFFRYIKDWNECEKFIEKHRDKRWSNSCKPVLLPKMTDKVIKYRERHKKCAYCKHLKLVFPKIDSVPAYFNCMAKGKIIRDALPDMTNIRRICSCYEVDENKYE